MTNPPAPKSSSPLKWILIGCGGLFLLGVLGFGGCVFFGWRVFQKMQAEMASAGESYLRTNPDIAAAFGTLSQVTPGAVPERAENVNGRMLAVMHFEVAGDKGSGSARVLFRHDGSKWHAAGAEVNGPGGKRSTIGENIPPPSKSKAFDD